MLKIQQFSITTRGSNGSDMVKQTAAGNLQPQSKSTKCAEDGLVHNPAAHRCHLPNDHTARSAPFRLS